MIDAVLVSLVDHGIAPSSIITRTLVSCGDTIYVQAGGGLVADSVPETEYQETVNKARAVLRAVAMARTAERSAS